MPPLAIVDRETWQRHRDAAGFKKGHVKASIGDLLDRFHKVMKPVAPKADERVRKVLKALAAPSLKAEMTSIIVELGPAAYEYVEKIKKEKSLNVFKHETMGDIPVHGWFALHMRRNKDQPVAQVVSDLNGMVMMMCKTAVAIQVDAALVKACPPLKAMIEEVKKLGNNKDPLPTREEWRAHRDSAGLKQGYTQASIGDLLDGFRKPLGDLSHGIGTALDHVGDGAAKDVALAAQKLLFAVAEYRGKLGQDKKVSASPGIKNVHEDLDRMQEACLEVIHELGHPG